jgi:hypothetical protein
MVAETAAGPLAPAVRLVRARGVPAQLCVIHGDRTVLDLAVNCRPDDLFWLFSTSKHRSGLPVIRGALGDALTMNSWPRSVRSIACP